MYKKMNILNINKIIFYFQELKRCISVHFVCMVTQLKHYMYITSTPTMKTILYLILLLHWTYNFGINVLSHPWYKPHSRGSACSVAVRVGTEYFHTSVWENPGEFWLVNKFNQPLGVVGDNTVLQLNILVTGVLTPVVQNSSPNQFGDEFDPLVWESPKCFGGEPTINSHKNRCQYFIYYFIYITLRNALESV